MVPIKWNGKEKQWTLGTVTTVTRVVYEEVRYPLAMGPVENETNDERFRHFFDTFLIPNYQPEKGSESEQVDPGYDPILEVEKIVEKTGKGKKTLYLIKWVGSDHKTWEPKSHLGGAMELVKEFDKKARSKVTASLVQVSGPELAGTDPNLDPNCDPNPGLEEEGEGVAVEGSAGAGQQHNAANPNPNLTLKEGNIIPIFSACMAVAMYKYEHN